MAAVTGRRKQLVKSQQLQPVAAAVNNVTADSTKSFLMFDLLRNSDRGEYGGSEWLGRSDYMDSPLSEDPRQSEIPSHSPRGRWAEQLYTTVLVVQTQRVVFLNKGVAMPRRGVSKNRTSAGRWVG